jgi:aspartate racemase
MEKLLSRSLRLSALVEAPTVGQLSRVIEGKTTKDTPGLVTFRSTGSRPPVFFLSGVGGTVFCFRELAGMLNPDRPTHGLPFPGFDEGDTVILDEVESIAKTLIERIRQSYPKGPYYLCGYSMGGVVAYEMARQLTQANESVPFVGLLDSRTPPAKEKKPILERASLHWGELRTLRGRERLQFIRRASRRVLTRLQPEPRKDVQQRIFKGTNPVSERLTRVRVATKKALNQYSPQTFDGGVTLFKCEKVPHWFAFQKTDELRGWGDLALGGVTVEEIPGYHLEIFEPHNVGGLATKLEAALEEVDRRRLNLKKT